MEPNVLITIEGQQWSGPDTPEAIKLTTEGTMFHQDDAWYIVYEESEATGMDGTRTTMRVGDDGIVTLLRQGSHGMKLTFNAGTRHITRMETPYGDLDVGIYTSIVQKSLTKRGGSVNLGYTIDFNQQEPVNTRLNLTVKALRNKNHS
ncbi:MAG: DUF1934 domain-containing protein [Eubacteriales bacterium]|nr:DUF1934 domain-containing protein [Eubacteriales bacterium]MDD3197016.1 DUF1934 domain-containing protein [Eubacteriales bacterium]MDD3503542.1 DUF1934 domain-containing protein [Eubacteriales bacterium]MDD4681791.1 DUF1934 domain-containing protein [Eubacteriales bacterium]